MFAVGQESDPDKDRYLSCLQPAAYKQVPKLTVKPAPVKCRSLNQEVNLTIAIYV